MTASVKKIAKRRANREDTEEVDSKRVKLQTSRAP